MYYLIQEISTPPGMVPEMESAATGESASGFLKVTTPTGRALQEQELSLLLKTNS